MKKLVLAPALFLVFQSLAGWTPFGPQGIVALDICFNLDEHSHIAICHSQGLYLYNYQDDSWTNFESNLPVLTAHYLDGQNALLIMGGGSNSDGIYTFNAGSGEFNFVEFLDFPNFLYFDENTEIFFVGHRFGLHTSTDGLNWTAVDTFNNKNMVSMDSYQEHYAVTEMDNLYGTFISDDSGDTWTASTTCNMYSCVKFDSSGKLYGIFPDESWSSGVYSSSDYGINWEVEFWSINISCLGFDAMSHVFVGWKENPYSFEEGMAWYDQENDTLVFVNDGLTNLLINKIILNPAMSAIALFACTDTGAFVSYNPTILEEVSPKQHDQLVLYPNPCRNIINIDYSQISLHSESYLQIIDVHGKVIHERSVNENGGSIQQRLNGPPGAYYAIIRDKRRIYTSRFVLY